MKTEKLNLVIIRIVILTVMVILTSCRKSNRMESNVSKNVSDVAEARSETQGTAPRVRRLDGKPCERKIDWEAYYQSGLKEYGVNDFSTENLIALLDSENDIIKMYSAWLLGFRKEACAIPKLEEALNCRSICVRKAVTEALLNMGNRNGVPVLQEFIEKASEELQEGSYKNTIDMSYAASVLADANETAVIPYLRQLANIREENHWSTRLSALRSLAKLYEKDASVLADIASMQNDEHPQVRKEAAKILKRLEAEQQ